MPENTSELITLSGVVVVVLVNTLSEHKTWAWMRMVQGPTALREIPGLCFAKVMGSGHGGGFGLRPSATHQGLITMFDHADQAQAFLAGPVVQVCIITLIMSAVPARIAGSIQCLWQKSGSR